MIRIGQMFGASAGAGVLRDIGSLGVGIAGLTGAFDATPPSDRSYGAETGKTLEGQLANASGIYGGEAQYQPKYTGLAANDYANTLDVFLNLIAPALRQGQSADRGADVTDMNALAPGVRSAVRTANPQGTGELDNLFGITDAELNNGMSPGELRDVQQAIRGGQAARGVGYGPSDQTDEVFGVGLQSRALRDAAAQRAAGNIALSNSIYTDPILALLAKSGFSTIAPGAAGSINASAGPKLFNPESSYASSLYGGNYAGALQTILANRQGTQAYAGMTAKGGDSIGQAAAGFI